MSTLTEGTPLDQLASKFEYNRTLSTGEELTVSGQSATDGVAYPWCIDFRSTLYSQGRPCPPTSNTDAIGAPPVEYAPPTPIVDSQPAAQNGPTANQQGSGLASLLSSGYSSGTQQLVSSLSANPTVNLGTGTGFALASGGATTDANQQSLNPAFPGAIHFVTAENAYTFDNESFSSSELSAFSSREYWSIGEGPQPTSQVTTDAATGTNATPTRIPIQGTSNYLILLDQFGVVDGALDDAAAKAAEIGITGLVGATPASPVVNNAQPLLDDRNSPAFNQTTTFALGEFRVDTDDAGVPRIAIRRSAQDRNIVKDPGGNDANDVVTANPEVESFDDVVDARFLPQSPTVKVPTVNSFDAEQLASADSTEFVGLRRSH